MAAAKGVLVSFTVDAEVPPLVLGDRARLDQVPTIPSPSPSLSHPVHSTRLVVFSSSDF